MKLDYSNKRCSNYIAGILVISVASIFLACALGIWDHKVISNNDPLPNGGVISVNNGNNIIENNRFIIPSGVGFLLAHEKVIQCFDTLDEGWLYFTQTPGVPDYLPLTLTQSEIDSWGDLIVFSYGGYEFKDGYINLYQKGEFKGKLLLTEVDVTPVDLTVDLDGPEGPLAEGTYHVDSHTIDVTLDGGQDIYLESNYLPELYDSGWMWAYDCPPVQDLDKEVKFVEKMTWSGCFKPDQEFRVLLAYKSMPWSPELPIINFIASFKQ
ncbi:MAG: hypothetical protein ACFFAV_04625 [Candidatus Hermodarchaeota archaeon]